MAFMCNGVNDQPGLAQAANKRGGKYSTQSRSVALYQLHLDDAYEGF